MRENRSACVNTFPPRPCAMGRKMKGDSECAALQNRVERRRRMEVHSISSSHLHLPRGKRGQQGREKRGGAFVASSSENRREKSARGCGLWRYHYCHAAGKATSSNRDSTTYSVAIVAEFRTARRWPPLVTRRPPPTRSLAEGE